METRSNIIGENKRVKSRGVKKQYGGQRGSRRSFVRCLNNDFY